MKKVFIQTFGCAASVARGEVIKGALLEAGFALTKKSSEADAFLINSCVVKSATESRLRELCGKFSATGKPLLVTGCAVDAIPDMIRKSAPRASLVGSHHTLEVAHAMQQAISGEKLEVLGHRAEPKLCVPRARDDPKVHTIEISQGCRGSCSFCLTRSARGPLKCYPAERIVEDARKAIADGCGTIRLTSQDNADYLDPDGVSLPRLVEMVCEIPGDFTVRVGMMNPAGCLKILPRLLKVYRDPKVQKFLHVPVQSGSARVLKLMNRNHGPGEFRKIVSMAGEKIPGIYIVTDIIAGFPGETDEDFEQTLKLVRETKPGYVNISMYSDRPGTPAAIMQKVRSEKIKERSRRLTMLAMPGRFKPPQE